MQGRGLFLQSRQQPPPFPPKTPSLNAKERMGGGKNEVMCGERCNDSSLRREQFRTKPARGALRDPSPHSLMPPKLSHHPPNKKIPVPPSVWPRLPVATATQGHFSGISLGIVMVTAGLAGVHRQSWGGPSRRLPQVALRRWPPAGLPGLAPPSCSGSPSSLAAGENSTLTLRSWGRPPPNSSQ